MRRKCVSVAGSGVYCVPGLIKKSIDFNWHLNVSLTGICVAQANVKKKNPGSMHPIPGKQFTFAWATQNVLPAIWGYALSRTNPIKLSIHRCSAVPLPVSSPRTHRWNNITFVIGP